MKVIYLPDTIDCTADPHPVSYGAAIITAIDDIIKVCTSPLVTKVYSVTLSYTTGDEKLPEQFESDYYSEPWNKSETAMTGEKAKENKVEGIRLVSFFNKNGVDKKHHLPAGLKGIRAATEIVRERYNQKKNLPSRFAVYLAWAFAETGSCSDKIVATITNGIVEVDYSNQDWWTSKAGYRKHCKDLSQLIEHHISPRAGE